MAKENELKVYELSEVEMNRICGGGSEKKSGISCPLCQTFIPITLERFLYEPFMGCPNPKCQFLLSVDKTKTKSDAIEELIYERMIRSKFS